MAKIDSRLLFLTTSPRTPEKMVPEIALLAEKLGGRPWDRDAQCAFMEALREEDFFCCKGENDPAFSARDRITRAPKSLGFVVLRPTIALTPAGKALIEAKHKEEVFLRQMLKFQVPSPYHKPSAQAAKFCVRPYLEMLRLVRTMGTLTFDELQMFGMQLTDWHEFDAIVAKIKAFRADKARHTGSYAALKKQSLDAELSHIYRERIESGNTKTRESDDDSLPKFLRTQASNMRDYADACFRYLRSTGLVAVSSVGKSLSIVEERKADVDYILRHTARDPQVFDSVDQYAAYLGDANLPKLPTDNRKNLLEKLRAQFPQADVVDAMSLAKLKDLYSDLLERRKQAEIARQVEQIKDFRLYDDIQNTFEQIAAKRLYDNPLSLEWNVWRAITMLDGGDIRANMLFDDYGQPLGTAPGNRPDIECDYGEFKVCVEVTLSGAQKQFEMEGEPVARHLGRMKLSCGLPCYCLFVAPAINEACVSYFYMLHRTNVAYYGGRSSIVPLPISVLRKMLEDARMAGYVPQPRQVRRFFEKAVELAADAADERQWFGEVQELATHWLDLS